MAGFGAHNLLRGTPRIADELTSQLTSWGVCSPCRRAMPSLADKRSRVCKCNELLSKPTHMDIDNAEVADDCVPGNKNGSSEPKQRAESQGLGTPRCTTSSLRSCSTPQRKTIEQWAGVPSKRYDAHSHYDHFVARSKSASRTSSVTASISSKALPALSQFDPPYSQSQSSAMKRSRSRTDSRSCSLAHLPKSPERRLSSSSTTTFRSSSRGAISSPDSSSQDPYGDVDDKYWVYVRSALTPPVGEAIRGPKGGGLPQCGLHLAL